MGTFLVWFCFVSAGLVLVEAGVRDIRRLMRWETGPEPIPSRLGAPVFYLFMAAIVVIVVLMFLLLILTGKGEVIDLDDDHLYHMH